MFLQIFLTWNEKKITFLVNPNELFILYTEMDLEPIFRSLSSFCCERHRLEKQFGPALLYFCHGLIPCNLQGMVPGNPVAQTHADLGVNSYKTLRVRIRLELLTAFFPLRYLLLGRKVLQICVSTGPWGELWLGLLGFFCHVSMSWPGRSTEGRPLFS